MKIHQLPDKSKKITSQLANEWRKIDKEHFGRHIDEWKTEMFFLYAEEKDRVIGYIHFEVQMGVGYVKELVVAEDNRREGVGKALMQEAEMVARANNAHVIYLKTGKDWKERKFYEAVGYVKSADLKNHYLGVDFIHLTKVL